MKYNFLSILSEHWKTDSRFLVMSADPMAEEINDSLKSVLTESFKISKLSLSELDICDIRNEDRLADMLYDYDVLLLAGGHVPTQNQFFNRVNLKDLIVRFKGIVIGTSAGAMNCAEVVYAQPELDGEANSTEYRRYLDGLNLTQINVLPHFQDIKELSVDGLRVLEDISLPDSWIRPFKRACWELVIMV